MVIQLNGSLKISLKSSDAPMVLPSATGGSGPGHDGSDSEDSNMTNDPHPVVQELLNLQHSVRASRASVDSLTNAVSSLATRVAALEERRHHKDAKKDKAVIKPHIK